MCHVINWRTSFIPVLETNLLVVLRAIKNSHFSWDCLDSYSLKFTNVFVIDLFLVACVLWPGTSSVSNNETCACSSALFIPPCRSSFGRKVTKPSWASTLQWISCSAEEIILCWERVVHAWQVQMWCLPWLLTAPGSSGWGVWGGGKWLWWLSTQRRPCSVFPVGFYIRWASPLLKELSSSNLNVCL